MVTSVENREVMPAQEERAISTVKATAGQQIQGFLLWDISANRCPTKSTTCSSCQVNQLHFLKISISNMPHPFITSLRRSATMTGTNQSYHNTAILDTLQISHLWPRPLPVTEVLNCRSAVPNHGLSHLVPDRKSWCPAVKFMVLRGFSVFFCLVFFNRFYR